MINIWALLLFVVPQPSRFFSNFFSVFFLARIASAHRGRSPQQKFSDLSPLGLAIGLQKFSKKIFFESMSYLRHKYSSDRKTNVIFVISDPENPQKRIFLEKNFFSKIFGGI